MQSAKHLAEIFIPNVVFMREIIHDEVAYDFLTVLLKSYVKESKSLNAAIKSAKDQLKHKEDFYPCVSFLPIIYRNIAVPALTWQDLTNRLKSTSIEIPEVEKIKENLLQGKWFRIRKTEKLINNKILEKAVHRLREINGFEVILFDFKQLKSFELKNIYRSIINSISQQNNFGNLDRVSLIIYFTDFITQYLAQNNNTLVLVLDNFDLICQTNRSVFDDFCRLILNLYDKHEQLRKLRIIISYTSGTQGDKLIENHHHLVKSIEKLIF